MVVLILQIQQVVFIPHKHFRKKLLILKYFYKDKLHNNNKNRRKKRISARICIAMRPPWLCSITKVIARDRVLKCLIYPLLNKMVLWLGTQVSFK
jgi:hypothetical protein